MGRDGASSQRGRTILTVDPVDVHKQHPGNVWIGGMSRESAHTLSASYRIPGSARPVRFVELMEIQRQAGMLQLHRQAEVAHDDVLVLDRIRLRFVTDGLPDTGALCAGTVRSHLPDSAAAADTSRSIAQHVSLESGRGLVALGRSRVRVLPRALYRRLRNSVPTPDPDPDAVAATRTGSHPLLIEESDGLTSDHPSDHLTAMQLAVAVEAAVLRPRPGTIVTSLRLAFDSYAESSPPPLIEQAAHNSRTVRGRVSQGGHVRVRFSACLGWADGRERR